MAGARNSIGFCAQSCQVVAASHGKQRRRRSYLPRGPKTRRNCVWQPLAASSSSCVRLRLRLLLATTLTLAKADKLNWPVGLEASRRRHGNCVSSRRLDVAAAAVLDVRVVVVRLNPATSRLNLMFDLSARPENATRRGPLLSQPSGLLARWLIGPPIAISSLACSRRPQRASLFIYLSRHRWRRPMQPACLRARDSTRALVMLPVSAAAAAAAAPASRVVKNFQRH